MAAFAWSLTAASVLTVAPPAWAQPRSIDIPAGSLAASIRRLSELSGVSIGFAGRLPNIQAREVRGASTPAEALRQMLRGSGYRAVQTGPRSYRIALEAPERVRPIPAEKPPPAPAAPAPDIIVTALKRPELLATLPATVHVVTKDDLQGSAGLAGSDTVARETPSLSITGLGHGRNRLFLRGVGDGPLNGFNQGSVAILLDEARINYDAPDPDWALVDVDQVEVLEGPQGPLYGTGALGGIVKISTIRPDASRAYGRLASGLSVTQDGDVSDDQALILNLPLVADRVAIRAVGYRQQQAGWIDNAGGRPDSNRERLIGGRLALRFTPSSRWSVDLTGAIQTREARDSQYVDGDLGPLQRPNRLREPRDLDARLAMMTVKGALGGLAVTSVTSISRQEASARYDATPLAARLGTSGATSVEDDRSYRIVDQEVRLSNRASARLDWLVGLSFVNAATRAELLAEDQAGKKPLLTIRRSVTEAALFGEASLALTRKVSVGAGARIFSSKIDDEGREAGSERLLGRSQIKAAGTASLQWRPSPRATVFLRAATAYRPGGLNAEPEAAQPSYEADELASIELGSRARLGGSVSFDATLFASRWQHAQADQLLPNGLVATRNAGNARNIGLEGNVGWTLARRTTLSAGFLVQSARLESTGRSEDIDDPRIPAVPQAALRAQLAQDFRLDGWDGKAKLGVRYTGATHLSFDPTVDRQTGAHATFDASLVLTRKSWTAALVVENVTDSSADAFAFGNPYRVRAAPQRTPVRPRNVGVVITHSF